MRKQSHIPLCFHRWLGSHHPWHLSGLSNSTGSKNLAWTNMRLLADSLSFRHSRVGGAMSLGTESVCYSTTRLCACTASGNPQVSDILMRIAGAQWLALRGWEGKWQAPGQVSGTPLERKQGSLYMLLTLTRLRMYLEQDPKYGRWDFLFCLFVLF